MAYDFVIGVDVGKYFHHACVLDPQGRQVLSKRINQHEGSLRKLFGKFLTDNASVLVIVDQPNNIGRLTVAVAQDMGADVRYLPGLAMRQLSRIHVGNSKTDVRDAYVIAHAGLNLPDSLRSVDRVEEVFIQLKVLNGIDEEQVYLALAGSSWRQKLSRQKTTCARQQRELLLLLPKATSKTLPRTSSRLLGGRAKRPMTTAAVNRRLCPRR